MLLGNPKCKMVVVENSPIEPSRSQAKIVSTEMARPVASQLKGADFGTREYQKDSCLLFCSSPSSIPKLISLLVILLKKQLILNSNFIHVIH
jgi:hypothetical protein